LTADAADTGTVVLIFYVNSADVSRSLSIRQAVSASGERSVTRVQHRFSVSPAVTVGRNSSKFIVLDRLTVYLVPVCLEAYQWGCGSEISSGKFPEIFRNLFQTFRKFPLISGKFLQEIFIPA